MEKQKKKLAYQAWEIFREYGTESYEKAKQVILQEKISYKKLYDALRYFINEWKCVQHPALISLACEAVGGNPNETTQIGAAVILLAGAADIHDDIIDQSKMKGGKPTVFGKFGEDMALLAGDALLFRGLTLLNEACEKMSKAKRQKILAWIQKAFFELGMAEAKELELKGKLDADIEECWNIIKAKASLPRAYGQIGALIGGGSKKQIEALGFYGETLGVLTTVRDDFIDVFEPDELKNRVANECLPLSILYALQNERAREKILPLLKKENMTEEDAQQIVKIISNMRGVNHLRAGMEKSVTETLSRCSILNQRLKPALELILWSSLEDL